MPTSSNIPVSDSKQLQLSASNRVITDHFFCFVCDEYVWDCEHLIEERISAPRVQAKELSQLQSFTYDGKLRVLEIEFRVTAPFAYHEVPLPPPPGVIQYFNVPRYIFTRLTRCTTARRQEQFWADNIRTRYQCQTVRSVCRLPRIRRFSEARNIQRFEFGEYAAKIGQEEHKALQLAIAAMKVLLLKVLEPRHVAGLGGLMECQSCGSVGANLAAIRHRNCIWSIL